MASLLDIAPARETIAIGGVSLELRGISVEMIVDLVRRFGNVLSLFDEEAKDQIGERLQPVIGAVIAAANGELGQPEAEAAASRLSVGDQAAILAVVRRLTMPRGVRPFLQDLYALGLPLDDFLAAIDRMSEESSQKPSST